MVILTTRLLAWKCSTIHSSWQLKSQTWVLRNLSHATCSESSYKYKRLSLCTQWSKQRSLHHYSEESRLLAALWWWHCGGESLSASSAPCANLLLCLSVNNFFCVLCRKSMPRRSRSFTGLPQTFPRTLSQDTSSSTSPGSDEWHMRRLNGIFLFQLKKDPIPAASFLFFCHSPSQAHPPPLGSPVSSASLSVVWLSPF